MAESEHSPTLTESDPYAGRRRAMMERRLAFEQSRHVNDGKETDPLGLKLTILIPLITWGLKLLGLWNRGRRNALNVQLREREWRIPGLPAGLDGCRILHLSDFHYPSTDLEFARAVEDAVEGLEVDLCVLTGDYRFGHFGAVDHVPDRMAALLKKFHARHGVYAVLGNHDVSPIIEPFRELGIDLLINEGREVDVNGVPVWIGGTEDPHKVRGDDLEAAMHGATDEHFVVALVHTPELIEEAADAGARLYFCGHTHGGQICLPWWGPVETNADVAPRFIHGEWEHRGLFGLTTGGVGTTDIPVRFNCPAEGYVITLRGA